MECGQQCREINDGIGSKMALLRFFKDLITVTLTVFYLNGHFALLN